MKNRKRKNGYLELILACAAFDTGCLTATLAGVTVLKCVFAGIVGSFFIVCGYAIGKCL